MPSGPTADSRQGARPPCSPTNSRPEQPWGVPLPASSSTASRNSVNGQGGTSSPIDPAEVPKAVSVNDLLALQGPPEKADHASRALDSPGSAASDIQAGDVLHLTGWIQRISRAPDNTYHLYVSPNRNAGAQVLVATVPPPDQAQGSPAGRRSSRRCGPSSSSSCFGSRNLRRAARSCSVRSLCN